MMTRFILSCFLGLITLSTVEAQQQDLPKAVKEALRSNESAVVYSIYPEVTQDAKLFMGFPILGRTAVAGIRAQQLLAAVLEGLNSADPTERASCFAPRHGLEVGGHRLLICYACHRVVVESGPDEKESFAIAKGGNEELARVVKERKLPWQGWARIDQTMEHQDGWSITLPEGYSGHGLAGTETLYLNSLSTVEQVEPNPGTVVLKTTGTDKVEEISTTWIDHQESKDIFWLLVGAISQYEPEGNRLVCEVDTFGSSQVKEYLEDVDKPASLGARIRVRPLSDDNAGAKSQEAKWNRDGFLFQEQSIAGVDFKVAHGSKTGIEVELALGVVNTSRGSVLITAEIPSSQANPLEDIVKALLF